MTLGIMLCLIVMKAHAQEINGTDLEDAAWDYYRYECESDGKKPSEEEYDNLAQQIFPVAN